MKYNKYICILFCVFTLLLIACSNDEEAEGRYASIGDPVFHDSVLGDQEIILNSVSTAYEYEGETPEYDLFIVTEVIYRNVSDKPILHVFQPSKIRLDGEDPAFHEDYYSNDYISPGDWRIDTFVFDVEEADVYRLHYKFGLFKRLEITWDLTEEDFE